MKLTKFEDIQAWQEARKLTSLIYEISKQGAFGKDYGLEDQIQRAFNSIMANTRIINSFLVSSFPLTEL